MINNCINLFHFFIISLVFNCTFASNAVVHNGFQTALTSSKQKAVSKDDYCGQYGNTKVSTSALIDYYAKTYDPSFNNEKFMMFPKEQQEQLIKNYILRLIFIKEADGSKVFQKGSKYLEDYEMAKLELKKNIFLQSKLETCVKEDDIYNEYSNFIRELKTKGQVTLKYAVFAKESDAQLFITDINSGKKTFETAVQAASSSKPNNQVTLLPGMWPEVEQEIFNTKVNNLTKPLKLQGAFIVAKVISKKTVEQLPSFQSKKDEMRQKANMKIINQITKELENKYNIQVFAK
jgi:hypothetical protein